MRCKTNALLEINHCLAQKSYVDWKYKQLADLVQTPPKERTNNAARVAYRFVTRSLPQLTPYYALFYREGTKRVPEIELSPLSLAVWFMDDGSRSRSAVYLNTQQFRIEDQMQLLRILEEQWEIRGALNVDKSYRRIRLTVTGTQELARLIKPHLLPEFWYKLPQVTP